MYNIIKLCPKLHYILRSQIIIIIRYIPADNKPTMHQLHILKAGDGSEVRIIDTVADGDWGRMAVAFGFDDLKRSEIVKMASSIHTQLRLSPAPNVPSQFEIACEEIFEHWLKGGEGLRPATWGVLMRCLKDSGYKNLARKVNKFMLH